MLLKRRFGGIGEYVAASSPLHGIPVWNLREKIKGNLYE